jgi:hypothetical protein
VKSKVALSIKGSSLPSILEDSDHSPSVSPDNAVRLEYTSNQIIDSAMGLHLSLGSLARSLRRSWLTGPVICIKAMGF